MRPGPKARRETRDANAEEATGEKQLLRLERPFQTAVATYNVIQNARGFLTKQVMRCRARLTAPLGRAQPPLSTTPYLIQQLLVLATFRRTFSRVVPSPFPNGSQKQPPEPPRLENFTEAVAIGRARPRRGAAAYGVANSASEGPT